MKSYFLALKSSPNLTYVICIFDLFHHPLPRTRVFPIDITYNTYNIYGIPIAVPQISC